MPFKQLMFKNLAAYMMVKQWDDTPINQILPQMRSNKFQRLMHSCRQSPYFNNLIFFQCNRRQVTI